MMVTLTTKIKTSASTQLPYLLQPTVFILPLLDLKNVWLTIAGLAQRKITASSAKILTTPRTNSTLFTMKRPKKTLVILAWKSKPSTLTQTRGARGARPSVKPALHSPIA